MPAVSDASMPQHIAVIMDGNGRWAKQRGLDRIEGHRYGAQNALELLKWSEKIGLRYLTLFVFSEENWQRPKREIDSLMKLLKEVLERQSESLVEKGVRLRLFGRLEGLPAEITEPLNQLIEATSHFNKYNLNIALNYSGRTELLDAVRAYVNAVKAGKETVDKLNWEAFSQYLYTDGVPDPDLIIRTSGEMRMSNFLLPQSAYSEFYFTRKLWPDFLQEDFLEAIRGFRHRNRRFGNIVQPEILDSAILSAP